MLRRMYQKKGLVYPLILAFIFLMNSEFLAGGVRNPIENEGEPHHRVERTGKWILSQQTDQFEHLFTEGKRLMQEEFDYDKAIQTFHEALKHAITQKQKSDVYFFLSLACYATLETRGEDDFLDAIHNLIEIDYHRKLDQSICPPKYIERYMDIKKDYGTLQVLSRPEGADIYLSDSPESLGKTPLTVGAKAGEIKITVRIGSEKKEDTLGIVAGQETQSPVYTFAHAAETKAPKVAVQEGEKKKGGGKKMLFVLGGILLAGGAAAALLLSGGNGGEEASQGSIQVNSTPSGADIYLDGSNTGRTTNSTLTGVSPGSHTIGVIKDGYGDYETSVSVTKGQTAVVNATLTAHTITVTQPTETTNWTQDQDVSIRWTTGGGASQLGNMSVSREIGSSAQFTRLSRMRASYSNRAQRQSREQARKRADISLSGGSETAVRGTPVTHEAPSGMNDESTQSTPTAPLNPSQSRMNFLSSNQKVYSNTEVKPQTLNNVKIELYRGGSLEETIISSTNNTGRYDWKVSSSLPDASNYKIRVSAAGDSSVSGESPIFTIARLGELRVSSTPEGATIWIDGVNKGKTNKTIDLPNGDHELRLTLDRYQDWEDVVNIKTNERTTVNVTLEPGSFEEDFDSGKAQYWKSDPYGDWVVENGIYKVKKGGRFRHYSYYDLGKFSNKWTYEIEANRGVGSHGMAHGPAFGGSDDFKSFYYFDIDSGDQAWSIWRVSNNVAYLIRNWADSNAIKQEGWNTLKIVANGNAFTFYANGKNLGTVNISGVPSKGKIGVIAWTGSDVDQVWFDNISFSLEGSALSFPLSLGEMITPRPVDTPDADSGRHKIK